ncbi:hypothetical protein J2X05_000227 [Cellvibrio fibrivorans]|uniref:Uncharacterized protein n=1 Tax=Cellvibrio fibrivorans TaxID=126350 RepID=A0ABU1USS6_9GAMM|nr:hypothetical protein [Cellvibrio fibrivorans]
MPDLKIDAQLVKWEELSPQDWKNLLIGNGFKYMGKIWLRYLI